MAIQLKVEEDGTCTFYGRTMQPVKEKNKLLLPYGKQKPLLWAGFFELSPLKEKKLS